MTRLLLFGVLGVGLGGCVIDPNSVTDSFPELILTDLDGTWQIAGETGLINDCVTIQGDRVVRFDSCETIGLTVLDNEPSFRSGSQIIWSFVTADTDDEGATRHTISVFRQADGSLRGTYSLRFSDTALAISENIIMAPRQLRL